MNAERKITAEAVAYAAANLVQQGDPFPNPIFTAHEVAEWIVTAPTGPDVEKVVGILGRAIRNNYILRAKCHGHDIYVYGLDADAMRDRTDVYDVGC